MVVVFFQTEQVGFGTATLISLATNILFQCILVLIQNKHLGFLVTTRELLFAILFLKPGVDAYRVATTKDAVPDSLKPLDHIGELTASRTVELFFEALPGAMIQLSALITGLDQSIVLVCSVSCSMLSGGFISAAISFEKDVNVFARKAFSDFYGFVPDNLYKKGSVLLVMTAMATIQLTLRCLGCALCYIESSMLVFQVLVADVSVFILYKVLRGEFLYWINVHGCASILLSAFQRIVIKLTTDFCLLMQSRHPYEVSLSLHSSGQPRFPHPLLRLQLGPPYWLFSVFVTTPLTTLFFGSRYLAHIENSDPDEFQVVLSPTVVYGIILGGTGCQIFLFSIFMGLISPEFRSTFYKDMTGGQATKMMWDSFYMNLEDKEAISVCNMRIEYLQLIKEDLRRWLNLRIPVWIEKQPEWWNKDTKRLIRGLICERDFQGLTQISLDQQLFGQDD